MRVGSIVGSYGAAIYDVVGNAQLTVIMPAGQQGCAVFTALIRRILLNSHIAYKAVFHTAFGHTGQAAHMLVVAVDCRVHDRAVPNPEGVGIQNIANQAADAYTAGNRAFDRAAFDFSCRTGIAVCGEYTGIRVLSRDIGNNMAVFNGNAASADAANQPAYRTGALHLSGYIDISDDAAALSGKNADIRSGRLQHGVGNGKILDHPAGTEQFDQAARCRAGIQQIVDRMSIAIQSAIKGHDGFHRLARSVYVVCQTVIGARIAVDLRKVLNIADQIIAIDILIQSNLRNVGFLIVVNIQTVGHAAFRAAGGPAGSVRGGILHRILLGLGVFDHHGG